MADQSIPLNEVKQIYFNGQPITTLKINGVIEWQGSLEPPEVPSPSTNTPTNDSTPTWSWSAIENAVSYNVVLDNVNKGEINETSYTASNLNDGFHTIKVRAKDAFDSFSDFGSHTVLVDTTPTDTVTISANTPTNDTTPTWSWNAVTGAVLYEVNLNNNLVQSSTSTSYTPSSALSTGTHTLSVRTKDSVGNYSSYASKSVVIDTTPPQTPSISSPGSGYTNDTTPTWSWNPISGAVLYGVKLNNNAEIQQAETTYTPSSPLPQGKHTLYVRVKDSAQNWSQYVSSQITIDTTAPNSPNPNTSSPTNDTTPTWSWGAVGGAISYEITLNNNFVKNQSETYFTPSSSLSDGQHTIKVRSKDASNNYSEFGSHTVTIDTIKPAIPVVTSTTPTTDKTPTWSWNAISDAVLYDLKLNTTNLGTQTLNYYTSTSNLSDGVHTLYVRAKDAAGNYSSFGSFAVTIDTLPPGVPSPSTTTPTSNTTPTWTWSEISGAVSYGVKLNNLSEIEQSATSYTPSSGLSNGTHILYVRAKDSAGNFSAYGSHSVVIDTSAPGVPNPNTSSPTKDTTPTWTWNTIQDAVLYGVQLNNNAEITQTNTTFTPSSSLSQGTHTLKVRAKDSAGNWSNTGTHSVIIDTTAPSVPVPNTNTPTNDTTPTWSWSSVSGAILYGIKVDSGQELYQTANSYTPNSPLTEGNHTISVRAKDSAENWSSYGTHRVNIDTTAPSVPDVSATSPTNDTTPTWTWNSVNGAVLYGVKLNTGTETTQTSTSYTSSSLQQGTHTLYVRAKDTAGNWSAYGNKAVVVDLTAPSVPVVSANTPTNDTTPTWTWIPISGAVQYGVKLNNGTETLQTTTSYTSSSTLSQGSHTLYVRAKDAAGNWSASASKTILIDTSAPNIPSPTTPSPTNDTTPTWTWSAISGAVLYEVQLNNTTIGQGTTTSYTPSSSLSQGSHTIKVRAKDGAGNWSAYGSHTVVIDTTPTSVPVVSATSPTNDNTPTWTWSAVTDAVRYQVLLNGQNLGYGTSRVYTASSPLNDGSHTLSVRAQDSAGNWSAYGTKTVTIDTVAPAPPIITATSPTSDKTPTWNWSAVSGAVSYGIKLNSGNEFTSSSTSYTHPTNLSDGNYTLFVRSIDSAGNKSPFSNRTVTIDATAPDAPIVDAQTPTNDSTPTWTWSANADAVLFGIKFNGGSEFTQTQNYYTITSPLQQGSYTLEVRAKDNAGNWSSYGSKTIEIDLTAPNSPVISATTPTNDNTPTWTWSAIAGVVEYHVRLNSGSETSQTSTSYTSASLPQGTHTLSVRAKDAAGNFSAIATKSVVVDLTAPSVPTISASSPTSDTTPTWTWNANLDVESYGVKLNNGTEISVIGTAYTPTSPLPQGTHELKVRAKDAAGNWSSYGTRLVIVDTTPPNSPSLSATTPTNDTTPTWTWGSVSGAVLYGVKLNSNTETTQTTRNYTVSSALPQGTHTLYVRAKDSAGNWSNYASKSIVIDTTAPAIPSISVISPTNDSTPTWTWSAVNGASSYEVRLNNGTVYSQSSTSYTPTGALSAGTHQLSVRSVDLAGNKSSYGNRSVLIDFTAPSVPNPSTQTPTNDNTPTWTWPYISGAVLYGVKVGSSSEVTTTSNSYTAGALTHGLHTIYVRAKDAAGNWSLYGNHTVDVDLVAPNAPQIVAPDVTNNSRPTWTWNKDVGISHFEYKLNSGSSKQDTENYYTATSDLSEGTHTFFVRVYDNAGNVSGWASKSIVIDKTAPSSPVVSAIDMTNDPTPTWSWTAVSDAVLYGYKLGSSGTEYTTTNTSYTPSSNLTDGYHYLYVRSQDQAGNWSSYASKSIKIDTIPPSGVPSWVSLSYTNSYTPTVSWGTVSGAYSYEIKINNGTWVDTNTETTFDVTTPLSRGTQIAYIRTKDQAGNIGEIRERTWEIQDPGAGSFYDTACLDKFGGRWKTYFDRGSEVYNQGIQYQFTKLPAGSSRNTTTIYNMTSTVYFSGLIDGDYEVQARRHGGGGNAGPWSKIAFTMHPQSDKNSITPIEFVVNTTSTARTIRLALTIGDCGENVYVETDDGYWSADYSQDSIDSQGTTTYPTIYFRENSSLNRSIFIYGGSDFHNLSTYPYSSSEQSKNRGVKTFGSVPVKMVARTFGYWKDAYATYHVPPELPSTVYSMYDAFKDTSTSKINTLVSIQSWNTTNVTSFSGTFHNCYKMNLDLGEWDVSNAYSFNGMFEDCWDYNDFSLWRWNISTTRTSVDFRNMFYWADKYSGYGLNNWNTSKVKYMSRMFKYAESLYYHYPDWDTSNVEEMDEMFYHTVTYSKDYSMWCVKNIESYTNFAGFSGITSSQLPKWNTCVTSCSGKDVGC